VSSNTFNMVSLVEPEQQSIVAQLQWVESQLQWVESQLQWLEFAPFLSYKDLT